MNLSFFDFASEVNFLFPVRERDFPNGKEKTVRERDFPNGKEKTSLSFRFKKKSQTAKPPEKPDASSQVRHPKFERRG